MYDASACKLGKIFQDFKIQIENVHDVEMNISNTYESSDLVQAYNHLHRQATYTVNSALVQSDWQTQKLSYKQVPLLIKSFFFTVANS